MKKLLVAIIITACICAVVGAYGQASQTKGGSETALTEADLRKILANASTEVNAFYKTEGFPVPVPSADFARFDFETNPDYQEKIGSFDLSLQALVGAEILVSSGKFISFRNYAASRAYEASPYNADAPPAKWTKDHVLEVASKFADIFIKPWGVSLGKPTITYGWHGHDVDRVTGQSKWQVGFWTVTWTQQTPSGIPYRSGGMIVTLSEQYGPDALFLHFAGQYEDEHITPIARDKALIEARKGVDKILAWEPAKASLAGLKIIGEPAAELMIVRPNNLTQQKSLEDLSRSNEIKARLAWVVMYKVSNPNMEGDGTMTVYIDAKDGSFLGGYF